jgi:SAM-dependent methyltransferase
MILKKIHRKITKSLFGNTIHSFKKYQPYCSNKIGLEIGGPSKIFEVNCPLPFYEFAALVDGCNFSTKTVWEGTLEQGNNYLYQQNKPKGKQFICEGNNLKEVPNNAYDFLLSSHSLEHFANPLKAIEEWKRVLKKDGLLVIIVPHPTYTFDNKRQITAFEHLLNDYKNNTGEDDLTHVEEVVEMHDYTMTPDIVNKETFRLRSLDNFNNRCLHHHVFSVNLLKQIFEYFEIEFLEYDFEKPFHLIVYGKVK